jgi:ribosomal protein S13
MNELIACLPGFGLKFIELLVQRFELTFFQKRKDQPLDVHQSTNYKPIMQPLNRLFSQIHTVNNKLEELHRLNIIRLYLIKSHRGRSHALGKPVRGQRTWSNAWNSYNLNKLLRNFISETRRQLQDKLKPEKINYKVVKKKYISKKKKRTEVKVKKLVWF